MTQIIFVSGREPSYVRNAVILRGLRINGANVVECTNTSKSYLVRYPKVVGKFLLKNKKDCDAVFIGYFGQPLASIIRKLTPRECARIQGFPLNYQLPELADSALYKQFGNSVSVPVIEAVGKQMMKAME